MSAAVDDVAGGIYLRSYLAPLAPILVRPDVTDIYVNGPGEIWAETLGGEVERHDAPKLDEVTLGHLARQIASLAAQGVSRAHPILSASLPDGTRAQVVAPPATRGGHVFAFRKHVVADLTLADQARRGAFSTLGGSDARRSSTLAMLRRLYDVGNYEGMLRAAVRDRCNIVVSGGTSTGKTTFLNSLIGEIDQNERLIIIEDTPELRFSQPNAIGLIAARSALSESSIKADDLVAASLRLRPDRIILGELRGGEAHAFLRAVNTGHPGSMTTVHANDARSAVEQIVMLVLQSGTRLNRDDVRHHVASTVDVFVHLGRQGGRRGVTEIVLNEDGNLASLVSG